MECLRRRAGYLRYAYLFKRPRERQVGRAGLTAVPGYGPGMGHSGIRKLGPNRTGLTFGSVLVSVATR